MRDYLKTIEQIKGRHTEFISLYIPKGKDKNEVIKKIRNEQSEAKNIKSDKVRKNVIEALRKCIQRLRHSNSNSCAIFSSNDHIYSFPYNGSVSFYKCDNFFHTELL